MAGRGKGKIGLGKGGAKRHRKVLRDNIQGIGNPALRRLARRGGVKRISGLMYEEARGVLKVFLENILRDAVTFTEHARRKTVNAMDVVVALRRQGRTLYGFGGEVAHVGTRRGTTTGRKPPSPNEAGTSRWNSQERAERRADRLDALGTQTTQTPSYDPAQLAAALRATSQQLRHNVMDGMTDQKLADMFGLLPDIMLVNFFKDRKQRLFILSQSFLVSDELMNRVLSHPTFESASAASSGKRQRKPTEKARALQEQQKRR